MTDWDDFIVSNKIQQILSNKKLLAPYKWSRNSLTTFPIIAEMKEITFPISRIINFRELNEKKVLQTLVFASQ